METTMRVFRTWAVLLACTLTLASCAADGPSAPAGNNGQPLSGTGTPPADTTGTHADTTGSPANDSLQAQLHAEQDRIAQTRLASVAVHDSLSLIWQLTQSLPGLPVPSPLLLCQPQEYEAATAIIGPEGGTLQFGLHRITIPAGALATRTVITAEAPTSLMVTADFSPHGLQFQQDVELRLDYSRCTQPLLPGAFQVVYLDDLLKVLETPQSEDYRSSKWIRSWLHHFSKYAVAY
jgi:hypothetical protein